MKSLLGKLGVILFGLAIFTYAEVWGADWKYFGSAKDGLYFYDPQSITRPSENIVRVWTKTSYNEMGVKEWVKEHGTSLEKLDNLVVLIEINCADKTLRFLQSACYSKNNEVINVGTSPSTQLFVEPESMTEELFKIMCISGTKVNLTYYFRGWVGSILFAFGVAGLIWWIRNLFRGRMEQAMGFSEHPILYFVIAVIFIISGLWIYSDFKSIPLIGLVVGILLELLILK